MFFFYISLVFIIVFLFLSIAFLTLLERHLLSLSQVRVGPNKTLFLGTLQPLLDGFKLMSKEQIMTTTANLSFFFFCPMLFFFSMIFEWFTLCFLSFFHNFQFSFLFLTCLVGVSVYFFLLSGYLSFSKFSCVGGLRASSQSVSFEVIFVLLFLVVMHFQKSSELKSVESSSILLLIMYFFFSVLSELNRAPFDFSEGESELVSGFNTEFSSILFIFLFLGEYGFIIFFCVFLSLVFFCFYFFFFVFLVFVLLVRSSFPRFRYDMLMYFFWLNLLPGFLFLFLFFILLSF